MFYSLVMLIINIILLTTFTSMVLVSETNNSVVNVVSIISFYFCTNTMITIFIECILPMIEMKLDFDERIEKYDLDDDSNMVVTSALEEVVYNLIEKSINDDENIKKSEELQRIKENIIKYRNNKCKEDKNEVEKKTDSK